MDSKRVLIREARPQDYSEIEEIYRSQGVDFYPHDNQKVIIALQDDKIVGLAAVELIANVGPAWTDEAHRRTGICVEMWDYIMKHIFVNSDGAGCYAFPSNIMSSSLIKKLGFEKMPWEVWRKRL